MVDIGVPSAGVKQSDRLCCHNQSISETVRIGQEAMARKRRGWADWIAIGEALLVGRAEVMRDTNTNEPTGRRYKKAMAEWLSENGFAEIDKAVRARLLECLEFRSEIDKWISQLTAGERFRFNHPDTVLRNWRKSTAVPDPGAQPKTSPYAQLKTAHVAVLEENHRLRRSVEALPESVWKPTDTASAIADAMLAALSPEKAEATAKEILKKVKERKASGT
ncbi:MULTISPECIES: hypothetical protein [unclassified Bradyrhizobium]|uniref:hypothetical protein n=1 Tax=unclassified Bradyrhizobium TaxID=2631580 RepID=UPI0015CA99F1|nr:MULTISPECIES: hypothetical protein [unclassified Bradyrhizobium]MBB4261414.1 hypothetical protein [Bradyrhizobium sp. CIR3A]NYG47664.1 hypothetical protein [Bradyrhizobium sp. IAR9]